jgi:uncharacterized membrane protein (DUF2068 family)
VVAAHSARLLPWIAGERALRGLLLAGVGVYLATHTNANLGSIGAHIAKTIELNPQRGVGRAIVSRLAELDHRKIVWFAAGALGYGVLELVEGVGLFLRKRWAEWLTVVATSLLVPLEIYELVKKPSPLKAAGLAVNVLVVLYLVRVVRRHAR